jgi:hypothetical protein
MARLAALYPHLNRVLARQRRQMFSDFVIWSLIAVGLFASLLAV